jgi:hypothetical protein
MSKSFRVILFCFGLCFGLYCEAQTYFDYSFVKDNNIPVYDSNGERFKYPWTGGINNVQAGRLDINRDGVKDLILFELHGNRLLPFLCTGNATFEYAPEYAVAFPPLKGFVHVIDFDGDNREDIFTYQNAGIKVYRNVSDSVLRFELFTDQLLSLQGEIRTNIFCTEGDYIAIYDVDHDGDLDILTFWVLGKYVQFHQNVSMELYGNRSALEFRLKESCWGHFSESEEDNAILLHQNCISSGGIVSQKKHRHTGSSMSVLDANGDGLPDLLLGDIGYPNLVLLTNGGTADSAHITQIDTLFPSDDTSVYLYSMPCPMLLDIDGDDVHDLLVSPIDFTLKGSENKNSLWWYKNTASAQYSHFALQTRSFLQNEMLDFGSAAYPVFCDLDGDGLMDILVGSYGYFDSAKVVNASTTGYYSASLAFLKNIGTVHTPQFQLMTEDLGNLRSLGLLNLTPAIGDLNGDGKLDILLGSQNHQLIYMENISADSLRFAPAIWDYMNLQLPPFPAVQLFDLDNDGLLDLIVGNQQGFLAFYRNTGTVHAPVFTKTIDTLGKINVRDFDNSYFGYASPCFFRTGEGETRLFIASEKGNLAYYKHIDANLHGSFEVDTLLWVYQQKLYPIQEGIRTTIAVQDIDNDGWIDIIVGNYAGGMSFYKGIKPVEKRLTVKQPQEIQHGILLYPNPGQTKLFIQIETPAYFDHAQIFDMMGKLMLEKVIGGNSINELDISAFPLGVYIIKCTNKGSNSVVLKFAKQ